MWISETRLADIARWSRRCAYVLLWLSAGLVFAPAARAEIRVLLFAGLLLWLIFRLAFHLHTLRTAAQTEIRGITPIIEAVPNAVVVIDHSGTIVTVNQHTEQWFGYQRDELIGQTIEILVPERYALQHVADRNHFLEAASQRAMGMGRELFARRHDGSEFPVEIGLSPLVSQHGVRVLASIVDLTARKKNDERFRLVVEAAPNAMVMANAQGQIVLVNTRVETWFGYSRSELLGQPVEILVPERFRAKHPHFRQEFMNNAEIRAMGAGRELFGLRKDGSEFPIEIGLNPIQTDEGMLVLSSIIDISERKAIELRFHEHAEQVALASRYKSEFLANMSHELRTPLNSILILSEQLHDNGQNNLLPRQIEYADIIHKSGEDLLALINDILDLSRIEAGHMQLQREKVILSEFGDYLRHALLPLAESRQLSMPAVMVLDFQRVYQIIKNLFSNAIKFTPPGGKIHLRFAYGSPREAGILAISLTDTGSGIPKDKQELIFQAFQQLDGSISRKFGGTGLGLAISRQLAELMGGSLEVDSESGIGSTFTLKLPIKQPLSASETAPTLEDATSAAPAAPYSAPLKAQNRRIAIVEDDSNFAKVVANCAHEHDFCSQSYRDGASALAAIRQAPPDAVIVDLLLPGMSGWQLVEELKPLNLPILIISCLDQPALQQGSVVNYLVKPVDTVRLAQAFDRLHREIEQRVEAEPPRTTASGHCILLVDDDIRNVYAMSGLLEEAGMRVCIARNGAEALDKVRTIQDIDLILMDMMMPVLDGYQATASLRRDFHFSKPILAVTASAMKGDREKCLAVGADDYLAKPIRKHELLDLIDKLLA
jgi:PAS domain S-box-containing protein